MEHRKTGNKKRLTKRTHWTLEILRDLQAFFWLRVFSAPKQSSRPDRVHAGIAQESRVRENTAGEGVRAAAGQVHGWGD